MSGLTGCESGVKRRIFPVQSSHKSCSKDLLALFMILMFVWGDYKMPKLVTFSCFMLFWVFYEMSGGSDFQPTERTVVSQAPFARSAPSRTASEYPIVAPRVATATYIPVETIMLEPTSPTSEAILASVTIDGLPAAPATRPPVPVRILEQRIIVASRVNLREGPSTNHSILDTLPRGSRAEILAVNNDGWAQIRLMDSGKVGWMAERLLSDS